MNAAARRTIRIPPGERAILYRQLGAQLEAGLPLLQSLAMAARLGQSRSFSRMMETIGDDITRGGSFSESLITFPAAFPPLDLSLISAGEQTGNLDQALNTLARSTEGSQRIRRSLVTSMLYPGCLVLATLFILPLPVLVLNGFSAYARVNLIPLGIVTGLGLGLRLLFQYIQLPSSTRRALGWLQLQIPMLGGISRRLALARFLTTVATGFRVGIELPRIGLLAAPATGFAVLEEPIMRAWRQVERQGSTLTDALAETGEFPPMVIQLLRAGEDSGRLDEMADRAAGYLEEEALTALTRLGHVMGPVLLVLVAGYIGYRVVLSWQGIYQEIGTLIPGAG